MYLVRVTLHRENNYQPLHDAMRAQGFTRVIKAATGKTYRLPDGTYIRHSGPSRSVVFDLASAAARSVGHANPQIVVGDPENLTFGGLEEVTVQEVYLASIGLL